MYLRKSIISIMVLLFAANAQAQFGPVTLIDTSGPQFTLTTKVRTADINNDGMQDIIRITGSSTGTNTIGYYLNNGSGTFSSVNLLTGPFTYISDFAIDDYNADGWMDMLVLDKRAMAIYLYLNSGGTFSTRSVITSSKFTQDMPSIVLSHDFTGDGQPDLIIKDHFDLLLFTGSGQGSFDTARSLIPLSMQTELYHLVAGNFNGDTLMDFAVSTSGFMTFLNDGDGNFTFAANTPGTICFLMAPGDLNGDGIDDMLMKDHVTHILINTGSGSFTETGLLKPANFSYRDFAFGDMDGDGDTDVYSVYDQVNRAVWFKNDGTGLLDTQAIIHQEPTGFLFSCALADMNGDNRPDPLWCNINGRTGLHLTSQDPSGIAFPQIGDDIRIYPNPAGTEIYMETSLDARVLINDITGRTLGSFIVKKGRQAITLPYPDGLYFVQIHTGNDIRTVKLVKGSMP